jgi:hypothetical protein
MLPEEICPWIFPLVVHEITDLHRILRAKGFMGSRVGLGHDSS